MDRAGWPAVPLDGKLLVTQQDALLVGGKVQAPPGYADHVAFLRPELCKALRSQGLLRDLLGGGDPARRRRRPELRPREVRSLRRVPVELHAAGGRDGRGEPPVPRRDGRAALGGELKPNDLDVDFDLDLDLDLDLDFDLERFQDEDQVEDQDHDQVQVQDQEHAAQEAE